MWEPTVVNAVPTAADLINAKLAIDMVEQELREAYAAVAQAQLRAAALEKDLQMRRAWIAPIRRVSFDELSLIFEFCGEESWKTPLRISGVSRQWRSIVLATPRAWAFLPIHQCGEDTIEHFVEHSGDLPLHARLDEYQSRVILPQISTRVLCLSMRLGNGVRDYLGDLVFPKMRRLVIRGGKMPSALSHLQITRFPALRELICQSTHEENKTLSSGSITLTFPPLQILSVITSRQTAWIDLINGCRSSLVSLRLHFSDRYPASKHRVTLTALKCLDIRVWQGEPEHWPMDLETPVLETYIETKEHGLQDLFTTPIHRDIGNVIQMHTDRALDLPEMPLLATLRITVDDDDSRILLRLRLDSSLLDKLERLEAMYSDFPAEFEDQELVTEYNQGYYQGLRPMIFKKVGTWAAPLPYSIVPSPVSTQTDRYYPAEHGLSVEKTCLAVAFERYSIAIDTSDVKRATKIYVWHVTSSMTYGITIYRWRDCIPLKFATWF